MTSPPPSSFTVTVEAGAGTAHLRLAGDLDWESGDELLDVAVRCLDAHPGLRDLRLDCAGLAFCDSTGLSALLMVHRRTAVGRVGLHLDNPPPFLERMLATTGVRGLFLTGAPAGRHAEPPPAGRP
ncbi:STAS domain-containing protein [Actinacidiphila acidipaludis]|uniref:STAS domain-containing protein n=1 Tax=Actinacidiphila acidipaludis TaxID=2873382 RepID=A0ABS7Q4Z0_9ACTN|nr:STAS domain-containing protein [Streptomyces acidipaludis]MBY8878225.1 STAS domain-containing protein [Streptomyces acidipaludis]